MISKNSGNFEDLGSGVEIWSGHFQSLHIGCNPYLNVDVGQKAILKSVKVHELMANIHVYAWKSIE
jgi:hypothetical protein